MLKWIILISNCNIICVDKQLPKHMSNKPCIVCTFEGAALALCPRSRIEARLILEKRKYNNDFIFQGITILNLLPLGKKQPFAHPVTHLSLFAMQLSLVLFLASPSLTRYKCVNLHSYLSVQNVKVSLSTNTSYS